MPKEAKIFLAEDHPEVRKRLKSFLRENNQNVVVEAGSLFEAIRKVRYAKEKNVNIAIIDSDLGTGRSDGRKLANLLREKILDIKIIPFSLFPVDWADADFTKNSKPEEILQIIEGLLIK